MLVKNVPCPPAIKLIGRISKDAMSAILDQLREHGAKSWKIVKTGISRDGEYVEIAYERENGQKWGIVFGIDGYLWSD